MRALFCLFTVAACQAALTLAVAQSSLHALRSSSGAGGLHGRISVPLDDDAPGAASTPADVGQAGFTVEFWIKGALTDNPGTTTDGPGTYADERWKQGRIVLDRGIDVGSEREWGVALAQGRVRFGVGKGDGASANAAPTTLEGTVNVLDGAWHHVALVRTGPAPRSCCVAGSLLIYVDGVLDATPTAVDWAIAHGT
jgi:Concanavalin A-like lectin/glucanases superfamily